MLADSRDSAAAALLRNVATLARLVEDLLDVSRITLGQKKLDSAPL
jgi:signal transduction histidine kinase